MKANKRVTNEYTHPKEVCEYSSEVPTPIVGVAAISKTPLKDSTVKLGFKELLNKEQIGISEQFCDNQKIP